MARPVEPDRDAPFHDHDGDGFSEDDGDCDDGDDLVHPDAIETCNEVDDDCDQAIDEDAADASTFYVDADEDAHGNDLGAFVGCVAPATGTWAAVGGDCDDDEAEVHPGAPEACNEIDDDCDESVDEEPSGAPTWYADADGDGFGSDAGAVAACAVPTTGTWATVGGDCDDADPDEKPGAVWFTDGDGDGFGAPGASVAQCQRPSADHVPNDDDCDDADEEEHPGAVWHPDQDDDEYGDPSTSVVACLRPPGHLADDGDCDDSLPDGALYHPLTEWYPDEDDDEHGDETADPAVQCEKPPGLWVLTADDCADLDETRFPGASEVCDGIDNDCDAQTPYDLDGTGATCAAASCAAAQAADPDASDGLFWVDPDGGGALQVYCEMSPTGPWTLVARIIGTSGAHGQTTAQGTLTSPTQTTAAKLSDADIARLREPRASSILRFECGTSAPTYFKQDKAFVANGSSIDACATTPTATSWPLATAYSTDRGVQTYNHPSCAYVIYYYTTHPFGCFSYKEDHVDARNNGTLWVK